MKQKAKKIIASFLIVSFLLGSTPIARADYWGGNYAGAAVKQAWEEIMKSVWAMLLKGLKKAATQALTKQIRKLVAGTADQPMVVANYEDFIFGSADRNASLLVSDFFRGVLTDVSRETRQEMRMVEQTLLNEIEPSVPGIDFQSEYHINSPNPRKDMFDQTVGGGMKPYLAFQLGGEHPIDVYLETRASLIESMRREQESKSSEIVAGSGFASPVKDNGSVVPGSIVKEIMAKAESADIEVITNATNWQEVVVGFALKSVTSIITKGVKTTSSPSQNKSRETQRSLDRGNDNILDQLYGQRR